MVSLPKKSRCISKCSRNDCSQELEKTFCWKYFLQ
uniref:BLTX490 n=1 Tax=Nephila pilipes TaxID=299642 RepID=A0A076L091_NEPPI|nr:BLTX490 [Nephila pilipes]